MEKANTNTSQKPEQLDLFNDELNEKIINSSMTGNEIIEKVYSQPDPKLYDWWAKPRRLGEWKISGLEQMALSQSNENRRHVRRW